jgi:hypothetical membrane protein
MRPAWIRLGIAAGVAAPPMAWALATIVALAWPGYDPVGQSISLLANAPLGWVQTVAFVLSGVLGAAWALGLGAVLGTTDRQRRLVRGVLLAQAVLMLGFALFPTDPGERGVTLVGQLHLVVLVAYAVMLPVSLLGIGMVMRRDARWSRAARPTLLVAAAMAASVALVQPVLYGPLLPWLGVLERIWVALPSAWQVGVGIAAWRGLGAGR